MKLIILYYGFKGHVNSTISIYDPKTTFFLIHDVKNDIGNNIPIPKALNYIFYSNYFDCLASFIKILKTNSIKSVVLADHTPFAFLMELICRINNIYVTRYCGSNLIGAAKLLNFPFNIIGSIYAIINGISFANKILANNKRSFWRYFWTKKTRFINSAFFPKINDKEQYNLEPNKINSICIVGHLNSRKRILELIKWIDYNLNESFLINVIGSGPLFLEAESLAKNSIHEYNFHGSLDKANVLKLMSLSKYFMINSLSEGFPRVVSEAMSLGCIVICPSNASYYSPLWNKQMIDYDTFKINYKNPEFFTIDRIINLVNDEDNFISNLISK